MPMVYARSGTHQVPGATAPLGAIGTGPVPTPVMQQYQQQQQQAAPIQPGTGPMPMQPMQGRTPVPPTAVGQPALIGGGVTGPMAQPGMYDTSAPAVGPQSAPGLVSTPGLGVSTIHGPPAPSRAPWIAAVVVLLALGGMGIAWVAVGPGHAAETPVVPPVPVAVIPPPTPLPETPPVIAPPVPTTVGTPPTGSGQTVRVQISTDPVDAQLTLDGQPISNPFDADLPSTTDVHHIEASLAGRDTESTDVTFAFPQRVVLRLARAGRHEHGTSSTTTTTTTTTTPTTSATHETPPVVAVPHVDPPHVDPPHVDPPPPTTTPTTDTSGRPGLRSPFGH
jgi:hypothetical protein